MSPRAPRSTSRDIDAVTWKLLEWMMAALAWYQRLRTRRDRIHVALAERAATRSRRLAEAAEDPADRRHHERWVTRYEAMEERARLDPDGPWGPWLDGMFVMSVVSLGFYVLGWSMTVGAGLGIALAVPLRRRTRRREAELEAFLLADPDTPAWFKATGPDAFGRRPGR